MTWDDVKMNFHCQLHLLFVSFVLYYQTATWQIVKGHVKPLHASNLVQMDMHDVFFCCVPEVLWLVPPRCRSRLRMLEMWQIYCFQVAIKMNMQCVHMVHLKLLDTRWFYLLLETVSVAMSV